MTFAHFSCVLFITYMYDKQLLFGIASKYVSLFYKYIMLPFTLFTSSFATVLTEQK
jgi:hypothetical protein